MKYYKSPDNKVFAYAEDGSQDHVIPSNYLPITNEEANAINDVNQKKQFDSLSYADKRAMEYPNFHEYLDGIVKGDQTQVQAYIDACLAVKEKYPKP